MPRTLSTAETRKDEVLDAAVRVFAARGIHGTPTKDVAEAAGISQAYLFRLFPTKDELAVATVRRVGDRLVEAFAKAAAAATAQGEDPLGAMGGAYMELIADTDYLAVQMHALALAGSDDAIRAAMRDCFSRIHALCLDAGADEAEAGRFLNFGMALNVLSALGDVEGETSWGAAMLTGRGDELDC